MDKNIKRIVIDLPKDIAIEIKILALKRNITLRKWLLRIIIDAIKEEHRFDKS